MLFRSGYEQDLANTPGLSLEMDFGEDYVYRVGASEFASPEDLEVTSKSPVTILDGESLSPVLMVRNMGSYPFVAVDEDPQVFSFSIIDAEGAMAGNGQGSYRLPAPLFLEPEEETSFPTEIITAGLPKGHYAVNLELKGGVLGGRSLVMDLGVESPRDDVDK